MSEKCFYVYVHRRATDGAIFYVGKGKGPRAKVSLGRNHHWQRIARKHGVEIQIVASGMTSHCACSFERALITSLDRTKLANLTGGGEGSFDIAPETKEKMRLAKLGKKQSPEHAAKSRSSKIGKKQPDSAKAALSARKSKPIISSNCVIYKSVAQAVIALSASLNIRASQGNISAAVAGKRNNAHGLSWSYDTSIVPPFKPSDYGEMKISCVETGDVFHSAKDAVEWVKKWRGAANRQCISNSARSGRKAYGYTWRYA